MAIPELSVILPMPAGYNAIAKTMRHLRAQTAQDRIELLLVAPIGGSNAVDAAALAEFAHTVVMEIDPLIKLAALRAAGVHASRAPIVVFAEDHCYPAPNWAAALIRAHSGPYAAVGPQFDNANPRTMTSWADFFLNFGACAAPARCGVTAALPQHNTSYKRSVLEHYGDRLEQMLDVEGILQDDLRSRGYELWLEECARTAHLNISSLRWFVLEQLSGGRLYGANRADHAGWSLTRRTVYVLGGVLTPFVRMPRLWRELRASGHHKLLPRMLPALYLGLAAHALGEMLGYSLGEGGAGERKSHLEFDRLRYVTPSDRLLATE